MRGSLGEMWDPAHGSRTWLRSTVHPVMSRRNRPPQINPPWWTAVAVLGVVGVIAVVLVVLALQR